jgi:large subunit ribosomal protein L9
MEVILKDHVPNLGKMGQVVNVPEGYCRNFLYPRGLAIPATQRSKAQLAHELGAIKQKAAKRAGEAKAIGDKLAELTITMHKAMGEGGKLYGSVTAMDIEDALVDRGIKGISRRQIHLEHPLKEAGEHSVPVRLHPDLTVNVKVVIAAKA